MAVCEKSSGVNRMKKLHFFLVCLFLLCSYTTALAVSADPEPKISVQPDGTQIKIQIRGDEFQNWHELAGTGYTVLPNQKTGYWEYADQNPDGTLIQSGIRADNDGKNAPSFVKKGIRPGRNRANEGLMNTMLQGIQVQRQSSLLPGGLSGPQFAWTPVPVSGPKNVLIILVNFADRTLITTPTGWYNKIFNLADKSVAKFYQENSFGALSVSPVSHTQAGVPAGIVSVTIADNHPNSGGNSTYASESAIINHALAQAATYVDFASYDTNGNGTLDNSELSIYFVYAGYEASGSTLTPNIWAHAWGGPGVSVAGKAVTHWALNGELNNSSVQHPMGVIAHELGHSMCGLPDLYDTSYTNAGMGHFSLMAGGSWGYDASSGEYFGGLTPVSLDAWSREYLGWTAPREPVSPSTVSVGAVLTSSDAAYRLINRAVSTTEYFLLENRRPFGWDLGLTGLLGTSWPGGMLITHIDSNVGTIGANNVNTYVAGAHQGIVPVQASVASCNMLTSTCRGSSSTLFYSGNNNTWTPTTVPDSNYYSGVSSALYLNSISAPGSVMTGAYSSTAPPVYSITGTVHAGNVTGAGIAGATVAIAGVTAITSATGGFTLKGILPGTYALTVSAPGYATYTNAAYTVTGDQTGIDFFMLAISVILSENFDTVIPATLPTGWLSSAGTGTASWSSNAGTVHPSGGGTHSGTNLVYFNSWTAASGSTATLTSPSFSLSGITSGQVRLWMYRDAGYSTSADRIDVYVNTSGNLSGASLLGSINRSIILSPVVSTAGWYEYSFDIPALFNSDTNYVLINGVSLYGNDIHLDDISVSGLPLLAPVITDISPVSIVLGTETAVTITGNNLLNATVSFSGGSVGPITSNSTTQIVVPVTGTTHGDGTVAVTTADGSAKAILKVTSGIIYTVTFDSNGGSPVLSQSVADGYVATAPTPPVKTGYTFAGWYSDSSLTTPFVFTTPINADITLYAKWSINSYPLTVTLAGAGIVSGTTTGIPATLYFNTSGSSAVTYGAIVTLVPNPTALPANGVIFTGWSGACNGMGDIANNNSCSVTLTAAASVTASFLSAPVISGFTPTSGVFGTLVTMTGTNLGSASAVMFNGVAATTVTLISPTSISAIVPTGATTGPVSVTNAAGTGVSVGVYTVTYPVPTVTVLAPTSAIVGAAVTITGTNLTTATAVAFNGVPVTAFTVVSATQITTTLPVGATTGKVTVTTLGGTATSTGTFTVIGPPTITSFTPVSGVVGTKVTLTGTNLGGATSVTFNGVPSTALTLTSATSIAATVPTGATTGLISVTTGAGTGMSATVYTVTVPVPTVTVLAPTSAFVGAAVTITGTNLTTATAVAFNGVPVTAFTVVSATQITTTVPVGATTGKVTVTTQGGTATSTGTFTVIGPPTITSFTPVSGVVGTKVTLTGTNLGGTTSVTFNGVPSTALTLTSATSIAATVPTGATTGFINVTTGAGTGKSATVYTVTVPVPTVTILAPTSGIVGAAVTLTGTNLTTATAVAFNGIAVTSFTVVSATQITTTVPAGATTGKVTVTTSGGTATSTGTFTVIGPPTIASFTPVSGVVGTKVTLTGTNLGGTTSVTFNGVASTALTLTSATSIAATVPAGATTGPISVTTAAGTATSATVYTVTLPVPTVTVLAPTSGIVGAAITLTGTNLTTATAVAFNGIAVTAFTVVSATQITTSVPAGATTGKVTVTTLGGTATSTGTFTVIGPPTITSFTPLSGAVGTKVTLTGTNLGGATSVRFNGVAATAVTLTSATSIAATVPVGATTGPISVTTAAGTGTSTGVYTVTIPVPTVTARSPVTGGVGTGVTLTGTNLTGATQVLFIGATGTVPVSAPFTVISATSILTAVPVGATTGKISVTTPGGTATSAASFTVSATAVLPGITSFTPTSGTVGTVVTVTGTNLAGVTAATVGTTGAVVKVLSATSLTITVPVGSVAGAATLSVTTPGGTNSSTGTFMVL